MGVNTIGARRRRLRDRRKMLPEVGVAAGETRRVIRF